MNTYTITDPEIALDEVRKVSKSIAKAIENGTLDDVRKIRESCWVAYVTGTPLENFMFDPVFGYHALAEDMLVDYLIHCKVHGLVPKTGVCE